MPIKVIKSEIPQPLANYSEASQADDLIFAAGQLASDWKDGVPKEARRHPNFPYYTSDIKLQTDYILKNMAKTFKAAGTSLDNVVKAQVFLMDLNHFAEFDEVWRDHFKSPPPRTTVGTTGLLVKDSLVEIDLIAALPSQKASVIKSEAPKPLANWSAGTCAADLVYAALQLASRVKTGGPAKGQRSNKFPVSSTAIQLATEP